MSTKNTQLIATYSFFQKIIFLLVVLHVKSSTKNIYILKYFLFSIILFTLGDQCLALSYARHLLHALPLRNTMNSSHKKWLIVKHPTQIHLVIERNKLTIEEFVEPQKGRKFH